MPTSCTPHFSTWAFLLGLQTVAKVQVNSEGHVQGVVLQDGQEVRSRVVLSCASPQITFLELTPQVRCVRVEESAGREPRLHQGGRPED